MTVLLDTYTKITLCQDQTAQQQIDNVPIQQAEDVWNKTFGAWQFVVLSDSVSRVPHGQGSIDPFHSWHSDLSKQEKHK